MALGTLFVTLFWVSATTNNVYNHVLAGVFYEILWLPMLFMIILIPLFLIIF